MAAANQLQELSESLVYAQKVLTHKLSYHKLLLASDKVVKQLIDRGRHKLRVEVVAYASASDRAKEVVKINIRELVEVLAARMESVMIYHEDAKKNAESKSMCSIILPSMSQHTVRLSGACLHMGPSTPFPDHHDIILFLCVCLCVCAVYRHDEGS